MSSKYIFLSKALLLNYIHIFHFSTQHLNTSDRYNQYLVYNSLLITTDILCKMESLTLSLRKRLNTLFVIERIF